MRAHRSWSWLAGVFALAVPLSSARSQEPVAIGAILTAFLADSGVATHGLPWTTGGELPIAWDTDQPVAAASYLQEQGITLTRSGRATVAVDTLVREVTVSVNGNETGIQDVAVGFDELDSWLTAPLEAALPADGVVLSPLKCSRETEPPSYGNVVWIAKVPGKTASGLWMSWNCAHDGCGIALTILYRKADVEPIECIGAS